MTGLSLPASETDQRLTTAAPAATPRLARRLYLALGAVALLYALLAGLRTVADPDLGWQMATGRWVAQHHRIPSTDVFSYTANGQPWIYPAGSALLFYGIYLLGGYTLLSCLGAAACVGAVALLLRRGSAFTAAIAILAMSVIADRTTPRAEMFTIVLFAAFLSILWQHYETGRAPLRLLPLLMIAWVNLHLGFIAGLGLLGGFVGVELLELPWPARRGAALQRLKRSLPWFAATALVTLVNPWGWGLYQAILRQNRAMAQHSQMITEWATGRWHWRGSIPSFSQEPLQNTLTVLMLIVIISALTALLERRLGAAVLLLGAMYQSVRHVRMEALTACVVVVVAGAVFNFAMPKLRSWLPFPRVRAAFAIAAVLVLAAVATRRAAKFVNGNVYLGSNSLWSFGIGPGWWLPQRAAEFIDREDLPKNMFNSYDEGGYVAWKLGLQYPDYIDGRAIPFGAEGLPREERLLATPLDDPEWQQEAERYHINFAIIPLERHIEQLQELCNGANWKPVYLDELAIVLVRRTPETESVIDRLQVSCPSVSLPGAPLEHNAKSFPQWVNTAQVLLVLRRNAEALAAADIAMHIYPKNALLHRIRGDILYASHRHAEAELEWLAANTLGPDTAVWSRLAELYEQQERAPEAIHAWQEAIRLASDPTVKPRALVKMARLYLLNKQPREALQALDDAVRGAPPAMLEASGGRSFKFDVAQGRAAIWRSVGYLQQATSFQEEAVKLDPNAADAWSHLAKLYQWQGRTGDEHRAEERAKALTAGQPPQSP